MDARTNRLQDDHGLTRVFIVSCEPSRRTNRATLIRSVLALWMLALHVFVLIAAVSCEVHHFFHPQSDHQHQVCAATVLSLGQVDLAPIADVVASPEVICTRYFIPDIQGATVFHYRLLPARAPPVLPSNITVAG